MVTAKEIMRTPVHTISRNKTVTEAAKLMSARDIGCLVVNGDKNILLSSAELGIITERDIVKRIVARGASPEKTSVSEVMSKPIVYAGVDTPLTELIEIFNKHKIRRLPVVDKGKVIGMLTVRDVMNAMRYDHAKKSVKSRGYSRPDYGKRS